MPGSPPQPSTSLTQLTAAKRSIRRKPAGKADQDSESGVEESIQYHIVAPGENLYRIGLKYNLTVNRVRAMNGMAKEQKLLPGQKLRVSGPVPLEP
jgi:LysM repeat protein